MAFVFSERCFPIAGGPDCYASAAKRVEPSLILCASKAWAIANATVIGSSHLKSGAPCQDFAATAIIGSAEQDHVLSIAVSDGAGSAAHSDVGSSLAVGCFMELAEAYFASGNELKDLSRSTALEWYEQIRVELFRHAEQFDRQPRDYSCTLLAALVGKQAAAFFQVGDGAIVVSHGAEDGWSYVFWPQHGEFANSTNFVFSDRLPEILEFTVAQRQIDDLSIFSDGIENLVLHQASKSVHDPFFNQMFKPLRKSASDGVDQSLCKGLEAYLASSAICDKTDDDKTLVMATRCRD